MKNKKEKIFVQSWNLYPFDILFAFNVSDEKLFKRMKDMGVELDPEDKELLECAGDGRTVMLEGGQTVLRLSSFDGSANSIGHLCHEVFHATYFLFNRINIKLSLDSDEAYAYAVQYMTQKALERFNKNEK